ncbi:hypothetical protein ACQKNB_23870 [Lysinibacillus xylanilyticus]|uniref:hypothetical protein n=1 Tax=Lysinibacillus xylanilyticus TaxID=582475 RepID=UPI003D08D795
MRQVIIFSMLLFLTGCVQTEVNDSSNITEVEVVETLQDHNIELTEGTFVEEDIFTSKLNGVKPEVYELNKKWIVIYEFDTAEEREKGEKEFATKTANINLVSYTSFIKRNILIFYVHGEDLNSNQVPFEKEIQEALDSLIEG